MEPVDSFFGSLDGQAELGLLITHQSRERLADSDLRLGRGITRRSDGAVDAESLRALGHLLVCQRQALLFSGHIGKLVFQRAYLGQRRLPACERRAGQVLAVRAQRAARLVFKMAGSSAQAFGLSLQLPACRGNFDQAAFYRALMELLLAVGVIENLARVLDLVECGAG